MNKTNSYICMIVTSVYSVYSLLNRLTPKMCNYRNVLFLSQFRLGSILRYNHPHQNQADFPLQVRDFALFLVLQVSLVLLFPCPLRTEIHKGVISLNARYAKDYLFLPDTQYILAFLLLPFEQCIW